MSEPAVQRKEAPAPKPERQRVPLGIPGFDDVLQGGLPAGHLYLLEGTPGAGKTTIALQFVLHSHNAGQRVLYVALSESRAELISVAASHGWDLDGVPVYELTPQEDSMRPEHQYSVFNPEDVELTRMTDLIARKVEEAKPEILVIDSLSELRLLARDGFRFRRQMLALKNFFEDRHCTVLLLDNVVPDHAEPQVHSIVHGVISLQTLQRDFGIERRRLRVQKIRGSKFREGYHDYRILTGGVNIYPRLVAAEHRHFHRKDLLLTGIAQLDEMLKGGIARGSSTLIMGPAGVGKSSLSAHFACAALKRGEGAAIYIFDESEQAYLERSQSLGADLRPFVLNGKLRLVQLDPAELPPGEFVADIRRAVTKKNARLVIVDSLNGCLNAMPDESFLQLQMHELLTYLGMHGASTFLILAQQGVMGPITANIDISYLADAIIMLRYFEAHGGIRKAISIFKKRSGPHENTIRELRLVPGSIEVGEPLKEFRGVLTGVPVYSGSTTPLLGRIHGDEIA